MVIFSLLIAILIDRATRTRGHWQLRPIAHSWHQLLQRRTYQYAWTRHPVAAPLIWIAPAIALGLIVYLQGSALLMFIVNVIVLLVALGCAPQRDIVRRYLSKAHNENTEECMVLQAQLDALHPELSGQTVGAHLIWLNFRYYFAVAFWFIIFGAAGAFAYALIREYVVNQYAAPLAEPVPEPEAEPAELQADEAESVHAAEVDQAQTVPLIDQTRLFNRILYVIEWPAARVAGFAYLLVGHFSRALPVWLGGLGNIESAHSHYLANIAGRAEDGCANETELSEEPCAMMTLAKRSMVLLLAATALATLLGWLA